MQKIPRFAGSELQDIARLLHAEEIPFDFEGVTVGASSFGASTEYFLIINDADFVDTLAVLMDFYRIDPGTSEPYEGPCPACETTIHHSLECPECGLSFAFATPGQTKVHPFYRFLEQNALLPSDEADAD